VIIDVEAASIPDNVELVARREGGDIEISARKGKLLSWKMIQKNATLAG
jgi:hypothetical protein